MFLSGEMLTAQRLNRLQPKTYRAVATSTLVGAASSADVPGASVTLTTETASAIYVVDAWFDYDLTGATTLLGSGNVAVDGVIHTEFAVFQANVANDRSSVGHTYRGTLGAAGSHTLKLVASPVASQTVNIYSSITVTIYEEV
ncbi:hypothetical protein ACFW2X_06830 [Streptomyces antibioticus]|uniref:hypothetical protein n=1 Tax=Streptomyces antibioticus TaxID=1890 RepID=UPI0036AD3E2E